MRAPDVHNSATAMPICAQTSEARMRLSARPALKRALARRSPWPRTAARWILIAGNKAHSIAVPAIVPPVMASTRQSIPRATMAEPSAL